METKRIEYLDTIKGFAILLMIMGHSIAWNFPCWQDILPIQEGMQWQKIKVGLLWNLIYSFHMASFFFVSGFLAYKKNESFKLALFNKCRRLLVPYIFTGGFIVLFRGYFGYWFLFSLWQLSVLAVLLNYFLPKINKEGLIMRDLILICIGYVVCRLIFSDSYMDNPICEQDKFCLFYFPYMGGYLLRKYNFIQKIIQSFFSFNLIGFMTFFINQYLSFENELCQFFHAVFLHIGNYVMPILGTLVLWEIFRKGTKARELRFFNKIGKHTFEIYVFHIFFIIQIPAVGKFWLMSAFGTCLSSQFFYSVLCSLLAISLSLLFAVPIRQSKLLSKLVLGDK